MLYNKNVSTWKLITVAMLLVILLGTSQVQAQEQELVTFNEVTQSNFPDGDGLYTYDATELSGFWIGHAPNVQDQLDVIIEDGYSYESVSSSVVNITIETITLEARNWTAYFVNGSYEIINIEQILWVEIDETDIDFTRTLVENETLTIEVLDTYGKNYRNFEFQTVPSDYGISSLEGFLKIRLTVTWYLKYLIWLSVPTTSVGDPIFALPILGALGLGMILLVYYFREDK